MKIKKCALGLSAMLLATVGMAVESSKSNFCGFYTGGSAGGSFKSSGLIVSNNRTLIVDRQDSTLVIPNNTSAEHAQRKNSAVAALYAGYGYVYQDLYFGVEGSLNYANYNAKSNKTSADSVRAFDSDSPDLVSFDINNSNSTLVKTKLRKLEPTIDFRPGLLLSPNMIMYGRIGATFNKISVTSEINDSSTTTSQGLTYPINSSLSAQQNKNKVGLRLGLGLEHNLCDNATIRVDYVHTHYRGLRSNSKIQRIANVVGDRLTTSSTATVKSISNNAIMLGVSYYW